MAQAQVQGIARCDLPFVLREQGQAVDVGAVVGVAAAGLRTAGVEQGFVAVFAACGAAGIPAQRDRMALTDRVAIGAADRDTGFRRPGVDVVAA